MTIGVFDAVHRGHQLLIRRAREEAASRGLKSLVFTFERHPLTVLAPAYCPPVLSQPEKKLRLIQDLEVDLCLMLAFDQEFAAIEADQFIEEVLLRRCETQFIVCGWNFTFGAGGRGDRNLLKERGKALGFDVEVCQPLLEGHSPVSSTAVRHFLLEGQVAEAGRQIGRRYRFQARVAPGDGRGRQIGFPTANLETESDQLVPADGVYAAIVRTRQEVYGAMLNIGNRPTFEDAGRAIEAHLFDFSGDLLGRTVMLEFVDWVRDERKFPSVEALVEQLKKDEATCRRLCTPILMQ